MAWPILAKIFVQYVVSAMVGEMLRPRIDAQNAKASSLDEFTIPTADASRKIPYIAGTVEITGPNVVWWGDLWQEPITQRVGREGGFLGIGAHTVWQTVGYKYHMGLHLAVCKGPADLIQISTGDRALFIGDYPGLRLSGKIDETGKVIGGVVSSGLVALNNTSIYGGDTGGGGVCAMGNWLRGDSAQDVDPYLKKMLGNDLPAWRDVASLVIYGPSYPGYQLLVQTVPGGPLFKMGPTNGYVGNSPSLNALSFVVRRLPSNLGFSDSITNIGNDANPAEVAFELVSDSTIGMGIPLELIDVQSFKDAAQTLATEKFGISMTWATDDPVKKILEELMKTVDGSCYLDFRTGKWTMALARGGYNVSTLPRLNVDNCTVDSISEAALDETANEVVVTYKRRLYDSNNDKLGYQITEQPLKSRNQANISYQDAVVSQNISYPMITSDDVAGRVADRDLRALSTSLTKASIIANRVAYRWKVGDCFVLDWAPKGIYNLVMRVQQITPGGMLDGSVHIEAIRDTFALGAALYSTPSTSGWEDPIKAPAPCTGLIVEAPYWVTSNENPQPMIQAIAPNGSCRAYEVWAKRPAETDYTNKGDGLAFTPVGALSVGISTADTSATLTPASFMALETRTPQEIRKGMNLAMFETGECVALESFSQASDGSIALTGLWRGLLDTVPSAHPAGERLWVFSRGMTLTDDSWALGDSAKFRLLPKGSLGTLALSLATDINFTVAGRASKPYPPGLVQINGYDNRTAITGSAVWTWRHRNRLTQTQVTRQDDPSQDAPEGTYTFRAIVGFTADRYVYSTTGLQASFFRISGPDGEAVFNVELRTPGTQIYVVLRTNDASVTIRGTSESAFADEIILWRVDIVNTWLSQKSAYGGGPSNPTRLAPLVSTPTSGSTGTSVTITPAQRIAISANGLLPVQFGIKTVNGTLESAERIGTPFTMTGLGMCLGSYLGGINK